MQQTPIKPNNIKFMPTELNYFTQMYKRIKSLKKQGNTSRLLIIALIIWNIVLTCAVFPNSSPIPQFTEEQNKQIMIEEFIPPYNLEPIKEQ